MHPDVYGVPSDCLVEIDVSYKYSGAALIVNVSKNQSVESRNGGRFVHTTSAAYPNINVCVWGNTVSSVIDFVKKRHFGALRLSKGMGAVY